MLVLLVFISHDNAELELVPVIHTGIGDPNSVPVWPLPDESDSVVPLPSANFHQRIGVGFPLAAGVDILAMNAWSWNENGCPMAAQIESSIIRIVFI